MVSFSGWPIASGWEKWRAHRACSGARHVLYPYDSRYDNTLTVRCTHCTAPGTEADLHGRFRC